MAQTLDALTHRMRSLESIHGIVHTMKTLSVINAAPYEQAARAIDAYHATVLDGLHGFFAAARPSDPDPETVDLRVLVVFGSDHGLCGNYNEIIAGHVAAHLSAGACGKTILLCVGAQMVDALSDRALPVETSFLPAASTGGLGRLANLLTRHIDHLRQTAPFCAMAVELVHMARDNDGQSPKVAPLLPLGPDLLRDLQTKPWVSRSLPSFSGPAPDLFQALLRAHVFASLVKACAEAMVTENAARLALMSQAEQSVEDRLDSLTSEANALRQSGITTELLDVIVGFEALRGRARRPQADPQPNSKPLMKRTSP